MRLLRRKDDAKTARMKQYARLPAAPHFACANCSALHGPIQFKRRALCRFKRSLQASSR